MGETEIVVVEVERQGSGKPPSKVEGIKVASDYLRNQVAAEVGNGVDHFTEDAATILKFHGSYQQDDRDLRSRMKKEGKDKAYQVMVRVRIPAGKINAEQYLAIDELSRSVGNGTIRITTRQEFQLHGVIKEEMKGAIRRINEVLLSTLAACGDVERNVLGCPAPIKDAAHRALEADVYRFASHFAPRSSSYYDIWLDGERIPNPLLPEPEAPKVRTEGDDEVEPIYGKTYLPRKFKTAFAFADDNCTDIHANDLGYLAVVERGEIVGYNVLVGGGLGTTPSADKTFPFLGIPMTFVSREEILEIGEGIIKVYRDFGNRSDRKRARIKYIIHDWGMPAFKAKVEEYLGRALPGPKPVTVSDVHDHLGVGEQGDGKLWLGIPVENGRIKDDGDFRLASALRTFFEKYGTPARLTCQQSILLNDLDPSRIDEVKRLLTDHGVALVEEVSTVRRWSMACPAVPTCGLAVTEAERALPGVIDEIEKVLEELDLDRERLTVRMTGCPNGCARPYNADIGLVGRSATRNPDGSPGPGTYTIFLGGRTIGDRLNVEYKDYVPVREIASELRPVFARFKSERSNGESFGEFCARVGVETLAPAEATS